MKRPNRHRVRYERELARELWEKGYVVMRAPASGGSRRAYPVLDLFAWDPRSGQLYAIEVKTSSEKDADVEHFVRMLSEEELKKMEELHRRGAAVLLYTRKVTRGRPERWKVYKYPNWDEVEPL